MAEQENLISTQDFILEFVNILRYDGSSVNIKNLIIEFNYYEDIFGNVSSGDILLNDSNNLISNLSMSGNDYISFILNKPALQCSITRIMKLYSIGKRKLASDTNESYVIHFCSEEVLLSEQYRVSKSYKGKKVSSIVRDICETYLNINTNFSLNSDPLRIEETKNTLNLVVPNLKPLEAINWASTYAQVSTVNPSVFLFYHNRDGFNFKSLQTLYSLPAYKTYRYEPKNLVSDYDNRMRDISKDYDSIISYEIMKHFNSLQSISDGAFANRLISIDIINQSYNINNFDYAEHFRKTSHLNENGLLTNAKNSKGQTLNKTPGTLRLTTSLMKTSNNPYVLSKGQNIKDIEIEKTLPTNLAELSLINTIRLKLVLPGDPLLTVGKNINVNLPTVGLEGGKQLDRYYSGKYLITGVRHKADQTGKFQTILEVCKESLPNPYGSYVEYKGTLASIGI